MVRFGRGVVFSSSVVFARKWSGGGGQDFVTSFVLGGKLTGFDIVRYIRHGIRVEDRLLVRVRKNFHER